MRIFVALILVSMLAGCSEVPPREPVDACQDDTCEVIVNEDVPDALEIRGVVVDETITPVAGVTVTLFQGTDRLASATTAANGGFKFLGLEEGFYRLVAQAESVARVETQVDLHDGPASVRLQVVAIPPTIPVHNLIEWEGFIGCSTYTAFVYVLASCGALGIVTGNTQPSQPGRIFWEEIMEPGAAPDWVQAELFWQPNQMLAESLWMSSYLYHPDGGAGAMPGARGKSPLVVSLNETVIQDKGIGQATNTSMPHGLEYLIWAAGEDILTPGVAFEQPFTMYFSLIYNTVPPHGWAFVRDGEL